MSGSDDVHACDASVMLVWGQFCPCFPDRPEKIEFRLRIQRIVDSTVDTCTSVPFVGESCLCAVIVSTRQEIRAEYLGLIISAVFP